MVEILGGSGLVVFCGCKLVTVGKNVSWLKCASPNETIIPIALETPLNDIESEAICATVMRILRFFVAQIEKCKHFEFFVPLCRANREV